MKESPNGEKRVKGKNTTPLKFWPKWFCLELVEIISLYHTLFQNRRQ